MQSLVLAMPLGEVGEEFGPVASREPAPASPWIALDHSVHLEARAIPVERACCLLGEEARKFGLVPLVEGREEAGDQRDDLRVAAVGWEGYCAARGVG